jgi:hypothetical protein
MSLTRLSFDLEMLAAARRESSERFARRWRLFLRELARPTARACASRKLAWKIAVAHTRKAADLDRRDRSSAAGTQAYIHRSMVLAQDAVQAGDTGAVARHIQLGIERWEACGLPLYGKASPCQNSSA